MSKSSTKPATPLNILVLEEEDQAPCGTKNNIRQSNTLAGVDPELQSDGVAAIWITLSAVDQGT